MTFSSEESALNAINATNEIKYKHRFLKVELSMGTHNKCELQNNEYINKEKFTIINKEITKPVLIIYIIIDH